jgi:rhodanese-related sulfurtransferase
MWCGQCATKFINNLETDSRISRAAKKLRSLARNFFGRCARESLAPLKSVVFSSSISLSRVSFDKKILTSHTSLAPHSFFDRFQTAFFVRQTRLAVTRIEPKENLPGGFKVRATLTGSTLSYGGDVTPQDAWQAISTDKDAVLIDVRTKPEWMFVGVPDLSKTGKQPVLVEWQSFPSMAQNPAFADQVRQAGIDPNKKLFFLCRT